MYFTAFRRVFPNSKTEQMNRPTAISKISSKRKMMRSEKKHPVSAANILHSIGEMCLQRSRKFA